MLTIIILANAHNFEVLQLWFVLLTKELVYKYAKAVDFAEQVYVSIIVTDCKSAPSGAEGHERDARASRGRSGFRSTKLSASTELDTKYGT